MIDALVQALRSHQVILFVGAGVSRHLGLPNWDELMDRLAHELDYDPAVFRKLGDYLELAEFYEVQKKSIGALRSWMDRTWHPSEDLVDNSPLHQLIVDLQCPIIYTTNYDRWLEIAFQRRSTPFVKIANVGDFVRITDKVTQIVKLHGDFDDDKSLVLSETSYFERLDFESPLDIKLRADSLGKTILFLGYSLSDINIRLLLYKLHRFWAESAYAAARPQSYIFLTRPNPVKEAVLQNRGIMPIVSDIDNPKQAAIEFMGRLAKEAFGAAV